MASVKLSRAEHVLLVRRMLYVHVDGIADGISHIHIRQMPARVATSASATLARLKKPAVLLIRASLACNENCESCRYQSCLGRNPLLQVWENTVTEMFREALILKGRYYRPKLLPVQCCVSKTCSARHNMPPPCKLTFDLLILKVVSDSRVTWATSVPILVFL